MSSVPTTDPIIDKAVSMARRGFTESGIYSALRPHLTRDLVAEIFNAVKEGDSEAAKLRRHAAAIAARAAREQMIAEASAEAEEIARACRKSAGKMTVNDVILSVAVETCVKRESIVAKSRNQRLCRIRQSIMYLAAMLTDKSYPVIGKALHRDHSTVIYGIQAHCLRNELELPRGLRFSAKAKRLARTEKGKAT